MSLFNSCSDRPSFTPNHWRLFARRTDPHMIVRHRNSEKSILCETTEKFVHQVTNSHLRRELPSNSCRLSSRIHRMNGNHTSRPQSRLYPATGHSLVCELYLTKTMRPRQFHINVIPDATKQLWVSDIYQRHGIMERGSLAKAKHIAIAVGEEM